MKNYLSTDSLDLQTPLPVLLFTVHYLGYTDKMEECLLPPNLHLHWLYWVYRHSNIADKPNKHNCWSADILRVSAAAEMALKPISVSRQLNQVTEIFCRLVQAHEGLRVQKDSPVKAMQSLEDYG